MQEIVGDLFKSVKADAICITTNGWTKRDGSCVMGRGCADQAKKRWPGIEHTLGIHLERGNHLYLLTHVEGRQIVLPVLGRHFEVPYHIVSFPVKPVDCSWEDLLPRFQATSTKTSLGRHPGWMSQAKPELIISSAKALSKVADTLSWNGIVIPRPGCGAGGLNWKNIKPLLEEILDDRFYIIDFPKR